MDDYAEYINQARRIIELFKTKVNPDTYDGTHCPDCLIGQTAIGLGADPRGGAFDEWLVRNGFDKIGEEIGEIYLRVAENEYNASYPKALRLAKRILRHTVDFRYTFPEDASEVLNV